MTATLDAEDGFIKYSADDIRHIAQSEGITRGDFTYLSAIGTDGMAIEAEPGVYIAAGLRTIDITVMETTMHATGIYLEQGQPPVIVLNPVNLHYDLISDLHPAHEYDIYVWGSHPWELGPNTPHESYGEWFRSDVYKDGIKEFDGTLGWADSLPAGDNEETTDDNSE